MSFVAAAFLMFATFLVLTPFAEVFSNLGTKLM
jgi:hypothetical protein